MVTEVWCCRVKFHARKFRVRRHMLLLMFRAQNPWYSCYLPRMQIWREKDALVGYTVFPWMPMSPSTYKEGGLHEAFTLVQGDQTFYSSVISSVGIFIFHLHDRRITRRPRNIWKFPSPLLLFRVQYYLFLYPTLIC
jgi:hypothetical protein